MNDDLKVFCKNTNEYIDIDGGDTPLSIFESIKTRLNGINPICAQKQLSEIQAEIEKNTALGNDTVIAVREKIADAQKDMASFIADLSAFLPQPSASQPSRNVTKLWKYDCAPKGIFSEDDIELAYTWSDEYNAFSQNPTPFLCRK